MSETTAPETGVVIANILPTLQNMPAVLQQHQQRVTRACGAMQALIDEIEQSGQPITEDQDNRMKAMIIKINTTVENLLGERTPFTQMLTLIGKEFTSNEGKLAPLAAKLQDLRNKRAREVALAEQERQKKIAQAAAKNKEYAEIVAFITRNVGIKLAEKLMRRKEELTNSFNQITLENFEVKESGLRNLMNDFPQAKLPEILNFFIPPQKLHTSEELAAIDKKVRFEYGWEAFYTQYKTDLDGHKQSLIDRLGSKKAELVETKRLADERERLRLQAIEDEKERQRLADLQLQANNEKETERLRLLQIENDKKKAKLLEQQEEQARQQEILDRQKEDRLKEEEIQNGVQQQQLFDTVNNEADMTHTSALAVGMFAQVSQAAPIVKAPETRTGWKIVITGFGAYAELFQLWFLDEGGKLWEKDREKFEKMTFAKLVTYAEKKADKKKIESVFFTYEETFTAVNRKDKKED